MKIGLIDEALLILVQAQFVAKRALHGIGYQKRARRRPVACQPRLADPRRYRYPKGHHPLRQGCGVKILTNRQMFANTDTPIPLQMRGIVDAGYDPHAAVLPQPAPSYGVGYQHGWLQFAQSLTQQKRCRMRMRQMAIANTIAMCPLQLLA